MKRVVSANPALFQPREFGVVIWRARRLKPDSVPR